MDFVVIRTFQNYFQAHITLTRLKDAGIQCFLKDEFTVTVDPILSNAIGGIKLVVTNEDEADAIQLLHAFDEEFRKNAVCPKCGSKTIELVPKQSTANIATAILTWIFGSYAISVKNVYRCSTCGYESENLTENFSFDETDLHDQELN